MDHAKMDHAMIIGGNQASVEMLGEQLWSAHYRSIIAARDLDEAKIVARYCPPSLIILVPESGRAQSTDALRALSERTGAPIIVATADPAAALRCLGPAVTLEGPFAAEKIAEADAAARRPAPGFAHAA